MPLTADGLAIISVVVAGVLLLWSELRKQRSDVEKLDTRLRTIEDARLFQAGLEHGQKAKAEEHTLALAKLEGKQ